MKLLAALTVASTVHADPAPDAPLNVHVPFNDDKAKAMLERIITRPAFECKYELGKCEKETNIAQLRNNKLSFAVNHMRRLRKKCMSWHVPSGDITGHFFPDVPFDAYKPVNDAFDEFYATNSLDDLKEAGEKWMETISDECDSRFLADKKRRWGNTVRKLNKLQNQLVTKNKKKGNVLQLMFKLDTLASAHGGMPRFSAGIYGWDLYSGTPWNKDKYVHPGQLVYGPVWPLNEKTEISHTFDFRAIQGNGVFMESLQAKVCLDGVCKMVDVATHDDEFGKKFWFDSVGSGHSDCGGVTCGLNSETEAYCYDKGSIVFDQDYAAAKIHVDPSQQCNANSYKNCRFVCESGWDMFTLNGKETCLQNQGKMRADKGRDSCASVNGVVPVPSSQQHNDDLTAAFEKLDDITGASNVLLELKKTGAYYWVDSNDELNPFFNWIWTENINHEWVNQDYASLRVHIGKWYDHTASEQVNVVCEKEARMSCE